MAFGEAVFGRNVYKDVESSDKDQIARWAEMKRQNQYRAELSKAMAGFDGRIQGKSNAELQEILNQLMAKRDQLMAKAKELRGVGAAPQLGQPAPQMPAQAQAAQSAPATRRPMPMLNKPVYQAPTSAPEPVVHERPTTGIFSGYRGNNYAR